MTPAERARFQDDMRAGIAANDATWLRRWLPEGCDADVYLKRLKYRPGKGGAKVQWKQDALKFIADSISNGVAESDAIERAAARFKPYTVATLARYWRALRTRASTP
jgi:hypothetical protein